jgi:hypothetical protein
VSLKFVSCRGGREQGLDGPHNSRPCVPASRPTALFPYLSGSAGKPLSHIWYLASAVWTADGSGYANITDLSDFLASVASNDSTLTVTSALLDPGVTYGIGLILTNFFGRSALATVTVVVSPLPLPTVVIPGPPVTLYYSVCPIFVNSPLGAVWHGGFL